MRTFDGKTLAVGALLVAGLVAQARAASAADAAPSLVMTKPSPSAMRAAVAAAARILRGTSAAGFDAARSRFQQAEIQSPAQDENELDRFGYAVAMDGDTLVVGAPGTSANGVALRGLAYVFVKTGTDWSHPKLVGTLSPSDHATMLGLQFGYSVAIQGDTIVVGPLFGVCQSGCIKYNEDAYLYVKPATGWQNMVETARLVSSKPNDLSVGASVAVSGNTVALGAARKKYNPNATYGAIAVYTRPAGGWFGDVAESAVLQDGNFATDLGASVAIEGNTIVGGAPGYSRGAAIYTGELVAFVRPAGGWQTTSLPTARLRSPPIREGYLGFATAISGGTIVGGAADVLTVSKQAVQVHGVAYVYVRPQTGWADAMPTATLNTTQGNGFGQSVAVQGDLIAVGSGTPVNNNFLGAIFVYRKPATGWANSFAYEAVLLPSDESGIATGGSLSMSGDYILSGAFQDGRNADGTAFIWQR